jgi:hypothetical protein
VAVVALLVLLKLVRPTTTNANDNKPIAASVLQALTTVPAASFAKAASTATQPGSGPFGGSSTPWTVGGKPVFYFGFEFCPYCAASRWSMVVALARFGTWSGLEYMTSSGTDYYPGTKTVTFIHAKLTSQYVDFQSVENATNLPGNGPNGYGPLQQPNATQSAACMRGVVQT